MFLHDITVELYGNTAWDLVYQSKLLKYSENGLGRKWKWADSSTKELEGVGGQRSVVKETENGVLEKLEAV